MNARRRNAPEFVCFHADRPAGGAAVHPNANLASAGYMRMLDLLFRSARLSHPGAPCTLLTEPATQVVGVRGPFHRVDGPVDHGALMLSRSLAQLAHVEASTFARPMVLLDSDILVRGSLLRLFGDDFDVGLTWRPSARMPINGGVLLLHHRRPEATRAFFRRFVGLYRERHASGRNAAWYGDQLALADCLGLSPQQVGEHDLVERDGCRIRLLPCDVYNFSPENTLAAIAGGLPDKVLLHFKGQRKRLMDPYWTTFLEPRESLLPWVRWRGWRARLQLARCAAAEHAASPPAAKADA